MSSRALTEYIAGLHQQIQEHLKASKDLSQQIEQALRLANGRDYLRELDRLDVKVIPVTDLADQSRMWAVVRKDFAGECAYAITAEGKTSAFDQESQARSEILAMDPVAPEFAAMQAVMLIKPD
jgi:hypothetical protein